MKRSTRYELQRAEAHARRAVSLGIIGKRKAPPSVPVGFADVKVRHIHRVNKAAALDRAEGTVCALAVHVDPFGRTPEARVVKVYPEKYAEVIKSTRENAEKLLLWPKGEPFSAVCYERPFRIEGGEVAKVRRVFSIKWRGASRP